MRSVGFMSIVHCMGAQPGRLDIARTHAAYKWTPAGSLSRLHATSTGIWEDRKVGEGAKRAAGAACTGCGLCSEPCRPGPSVVTAPDISSAVAPRTCRARPPFYEAGSGFSCGRDPYFPPWQDVLQLNAFHPGLRRAAMQTLHEIADQCDGVRCDMAMLLVTRVFEQTWSVRAGSLPAGEYWHEIIRAIRGARPDFLFLAEAYWDLEWELMQQGFDYCYDKRLLDRLEHAFAEQVRLHFQGRSRLSGEAGPLHRESRRGPSGSDIPGRKGQAAAVTVLAPGAKLCTRESWTGGGEIPRN
jgi:hypothetical protein